VYFAFKVFEAKCKDKLYLMGKLLIFCPFLKRSPLKPGILFPFGEVIIHPLGAF